MTGWLIATTLYLAGCANNAPPCPFDAAADNAPSAGCFSVVDNELLLVQGLNGKISVPGGLSKTGESAQCTAFRETWEETGLELKPRDLIEVFDTGFHLYRCEQMKKANTINPPPRLEVRAAFYLPPALFDDYEWRYEDQKDLLLQLLTTHEKHEGSGELLSP